MSDKLTIEDVPGISSETAESIIREAVQREVYDGQVQEEEGKNQEVASKLIVLSLDEWQSSSPAELKGEIGDDVRALLGLAGINADAEGNLSVGDVPEPSVEEDPDDGMEEPWDGYDSMTVKQVIAELNTYRREDNLDDDAKAYVRKYEQGRKDRSGILADLDLEPVKPTGEDEAAEEVQTAVDRDDERDERKKIVVEVDGIKAEWAWDDIVRHVIDNGNDNLTVKDPAKKAALESLKASGSARNVESELDQEPVHEPLAGVREAAQQARKIFLEKIKSERLPEPPEPDFEEPVMPTDPDSLKDEKLYQLYLRFGALLSRTNWLLGLAHVDAIYCQRVLERKRAEAFIVNRDEKPAEVREARVELDEHVVEWTDLHGSAEEEVKGLTRLSSAYQGNVDRLSRIGGFRKDESDRSRS